jgi:hypothetical protein
MILLEAKQGLSHIVRFVIPWSITCSSSFDHIRGPKHVDLDVSYDLWWFNDLAFKIIIDIKS